MNSVTVNVQIQFDVEGKGDLEDVLNGLGDINNVLNERLSSINPIILTGSIDSSDIHIHIDESSIDFADDGNCLYCGTDCFEGEMCDEQQAGGF